MKLLKNNIRRAISYVLSSIMVLALFVGIVPMEVEAATFLNPNINANSITLYDSGCLKSITMTIQAVLENGNSKYETAYGRIAIHNAESPFGYKNGVTNVGQTNWLPDVDIKGIDTTLMTFAKDGEFEWTDCKPHTITVTFDDKSIDLLSETTNKYYIYLWTRSDKFGIYPDAKLGYIETGNGKLMFDGQTLSSVPIKVTLNDNALNNGYAVAKIYANDGQNDQYIDVEIENGETKLLGDLSNKVKVFIYADEYHNMSKDNVPSVTVDTEDASIGSITYNGEGFFECTITGITEDTTISVAGESIAIVPGEIEKIVDIKEAAPIKAATFNNTIDESFINSVFNADDIHQIKLGYNAKVGLTINESSATSGNVTNFEAKAKEILGDDPSLKYFDLGLYTKLDNASEKNITLSELDITLDIPTDLLNTNAGVTRVYKLLKLQNDGNVSVIDSAAFDLTANKILFKTNGISTYAIAYKDYSRGSFDTDVKIENPEQLPIKGATLKYNEADLLNSNIFSLEEKNSFELSGEVLALRLDVKEISVADDVHQNFEQVAASKFDDAAPTGIKYFDANLFKIVGINETKVTSDNIEPGIEIIFNIDPDLLKCKAGYERTYKLLRMHNGTVEEIENAKFDTTAGTVTFTTNKFSTYAIAYKDTKITNNTQPAPDTNDEKTEKPDKDKKDEPVKVDKVVASNVNKKDEVPKTGDSNVTMYAFLLALVSGAGIVLSARKRRAYNKEN